MVAVLSIAALVSTRSFADTVTLTQASTHGSTGGGEFIATPTGGLLGSTPFKTFCIEYNELINFNTPYNYVLSDKAVNGGVAGGNPDPISLGTAWIYSQYRQGVLAGYTGNTASQDTLQNAFWWLENEITLADPGANSYLAAAYTSLASFGVTTLADLQQNAGTQNFGVSAMNLTDQNSIKKQDQLAYVSVPEASASLLFSMSLTGLPWFVRRKK